MLKMVSNPMVEKVAEAIYGAALWDGYTSPSKLVSLKWDVLRDACKEPFMKLAEAAIASMRGEIQNGDYISRADAVSVIDQKIANRERLEDARALLGSMPAADAAPVVHARWVKVEDGDFYCSRCLIEASGVDVSELDYCPKCGARMDANEDAHADKA
jgi:hypothetical protein